MVGGVYAVMGWGESSDSVCKTMGYEHDCSETGYERDFGPLSAVFVV